MKINNTHAWDLTPSRAIALQKRLVRQVIERKPSGPLGYIAGIDCAPSADYAFYYAAAILWDRQERKIIEQHIGKAPLTFPYIPGLLSFREIPAILTALSQLNRQPDLIMVDGQGIAYLNRPAKRIALWL